MIQSQTKPWLVSFSFDILKNLITDFFWIKEYFTYLKTYELYESEALEDRMIFLFVFVPILCSEIGIYVETSNMQRIRPQKKRFNHVAGIPNELYTTQSLPHYR